MKLITDRDNNTKYFYTLATMRKKRNWIRCIKIKDLKIKDSRLLKIKIVEHFKESYTQASVSELTLPEKCCEEIYHLKLLVGWRGLQMMKKKRDCMVL